MDVSPQLLDDDPGRPTPAQHCTPPEASLHYPLVGWMVGVRKGDEEDGDPSLGDEVSVVDLVESGG